MMYDRSVGYRIVSLTQLGDDFRCAESFRRCRNADAIVGFVEDILQSGPRLSRRERSVVERALDLAVGFEGCVWDNLRRGQDDFARQIDVLRHILVQQKCLEGTLHNNRFSPEHVKAYVQSRFTRALIFP